MSRINALTVALEGDLSDEDVKPIVAAIQMIRGVLAVETHEVEPESWAVEMQVRADLREKLFKVFYPKEGM